MIGFPPGRGNTARPDPCPPRRRGRNPRVAIGCVTTTGRHEETDMVESGEHEVAHSGNTGGRPNEQGEPVAHLDGQA